MTLLVVLHAEALKMKRTIALKMVAIAPLAVGLLILFMASQAPFSFIRRTADPWLALLRLNLLVWAVLMMPLFITLETALVAGIDHSENQWKNLFARPVPRWTWYVAKLLVVMAMTAASTAILIGGVLLAGRLLPLVQPELNFSAPIPWAEMGAQSSGVSALALLALTIQHWVSLRWRSFSVSTGVGIVAIVASYLMIVMSRQAGGWMKYFPWALPMLSVGTPRQDLGGVLWISTALAVLVAMAGCLDFCRREVK
ncbi:MAG: ABC transporter permease [Acidobacteriota bacterium]